MTINCIIVDDELIARRGIEKYIERIPFLHTIASVRTAGEAKVFLEKNKADLMMLDIEMPQTKGFDFLKALQHPPLTIIITAYPEYALEGYELNVIDYIVKPFSHERFLKACSKAKEYLELKSGSETNKPGRQFLYIKAKGKIEKIFVKDILFVEAKENYSAFHTLNGNYLVLLSLKSVEESLESDRFMRVHKSYIVSLGKITRIDGHTIFITEHKIPLSREAKPVLIAALAKDNLMRG